VAQTLLREPRIPIQVKAFIDGIVVEEPGSST